MVFYHVTSYQRQSRSVCSTNDNITEYEDHSRAYRHLSVAVRRLGVRNTEPSRGTVAPF